MRYAFFGTPRFAALVLEKLIAAKMPPALLVCNPDKPSGRKQIITPPPTKVLAEKRRIPVWQPPQLEMESCKLKIGDLDLAVVAAYAKILPLEILKMPRLGIIGVHPSLLPKYRGTTPIQSAILAGEAETGTTIFLLDKQVDHGPILSSEKLEIRNEDAFLSLMERLAELSGNLLVETLPKFAAGKIDLVSQNEAEATLTRKFKTEDGLVDPEKDDPALIARKMRALNPEPGVYAIKNGKRIKLLDQKTIQYEGKKPQKVADAMDFLRR